MQTEDSGAKHPHVITHLFADGGRVVSTTKTSYEHYLGGDNLSEKVRALMRDQHKNMVIALRDGELDHLLVSGAGATGDAESDAATASLPAAAIVDAAEPSPAQEGPSCPPSEPIELFDGELAPPAVPISPAAPAPKIPDTESGRPRVPSPPPGDSPGTYSFVGSRSSPPPRSVPPPSGPPGSVPPRSAFDPGASARGPVSRPPRRPMPTSPAQRRIRSSAPPLSDAPPPAIEGTAPRRISRPPASSPVPSDERPTGVFNRGSARSHATVPDPSVAAQHAVHVFGERYVSERRFDEVVAAFVRRE